MLSQPSAGRAKEAVVQPRRQVAHNRLYSPTSHCQRHVKGETAPGIQKAVLAHTTDWCKLGRGEAFAKGTGRKNWNRRGRQLPVSGKADALHKRLLLYESSQGAAIIPNRAVLGSPGGTPQLVLCLLGRWMKSFTLPVYHILQVESLWNTDEIRREK